MSEEIEKYPPNFIRNIIEKDVQAGKIINIKNAGAYKFYASPGDDANRFVVRFSNNETPSPFVNDNNSSMAVYQSGKKIVIASEEMMTGTVTVYDLLGQEVMSERIANTTNHQLDVVSQKGYYIVTVKTNTGVKNQKLYIR